LLGNLRSQQGCQSKSLCEPTAVRKLAGTVNTVLYVTRRFRTAPRELPSRPRCNLSRVGVTGGRDRVTPLLPARDTRGNFCQLLHFCNKVSRGYKNVRSICRVLHSRCHFDRSKTVNIREQSKKISMVTREVKLGPLPSHC